MKKVKFETQKVCQKQILADLVNVSIIVMWSFYYNLIQEVSLPADTNVTASVTIKVIYLWITL